MKEWKGWKICKFTNHILFINSLGYTCHLTNKCFPFQSLKLSSVCFQRNQWSVTLLSDERSGLSGLETANVYEGLGVSRVCIHRESGSNPLVTKICLEAFEELSIVLKWRQHMFGMAFPYILKWHTGGPWTMQGLGVLTHHTDKNLCMTFDSPKFNY